MVRRRGFTIPVWLAAALAACGDDPMPPVACGNIPQQTLTVGEQALVEPCFEDPEMGQLTLAAVSSNPEVATAEVAGDRVRIGGVSPGTAAIAVTATDPDGLVGELYFDVLVPNRPPVLLGEMPPTRVSAGGSPVRLVLSEYFADPDGKQLTYRATSSDTTVASVAVTADTLAVTGGSEGVATVTVTAIDPGGLSTTARMEVMVADGGPDLLFTGVTPRSVTASPGDTVVARFTVANVGTQPSDSTLPRVFISDDTTITTSDRELGVLDALGPLAPSEEVSIDVEFYLSVNLPPVVIYVGVCLDVVPWETNQANNCSPVFTITVTASSTQGASDAGSEGASDALVVFLPGSGRPNH